MHRWIGAWSIGRTLAGVLAVILVCAPAIVAARQSTPSLAEIARQEAERRKAIKTPSKVYTDKEVRGTGPSPFAAAMALPPPPTPTPVADAPVPAAAAAEPAHDEAWWKARMNQAREGLRRNESFAEALQSRINGLTADFVNRDDPAQRAKIGEDRAKAAVELDRVRIEIDQGRKAVADIEEEARQAGVPPGWIR